MLVIVSRPLAVDLSSKLERSSQHVQFELKSTFYFRKKIPTLKILDTHVALLEEIRQQAMKDLGINIVFEPKGSAVVLQKAASRPGSFDLYEHIVIKIMVLSK